MEDREARARARIKDIDTEVTKLREEIDRLQFERDAYGAMVAMGAEKRRVLRNGRGENWEPRGGSKKLLDWLLAFDGDALPRSIGKLGTAAGIPSGSAYYTLDALIRHGYVERIEFPNGLWGVKVQGRDDTLMSKGSRRHGPRKPKKTPRRRFDHVQPLAPQKVRPLDADHQAVVDGRTLFPSSVREPSAEERILVPGYNSSKLGSHVTKGPWSGFPLFSLSLEERATCPRSCHHWRTCYGNATPFAHRFAHGPAFEAALEVELSALQIRHPGGFVVRVHNLGDFYSTGYVDLWRGWLDRFPALHAFGYTARDIVQDEIGVAVWALTQERWDRFAIRYSAPHPSPQGATTIDRVPEKPRVPEGIVCPAQTGATGCCGSCGLCWSKSARLETIVFVLHGKKSAGRAKGSRNTHKATPRQPLPRIVARDEVETLPDYATDRPLPDPVSRRCAGCQEIFISKRIEEYTCPRCVAAEEPDPTSKASVLHGLP